MLRFLADYNFVEEINDMLRFLRYDNVLTIKYDMR